MLNFWFMTAGAFAAFSPLDGLYVRGLEAYEHDILEVEYEGEKVICEVMYEAGGTLTYRYDRRRTRCIPE